MSKFFMTIETDNQKLLEELWFENQENFDKFGCSLKFDKETSKLVSEEWSEKVKDQERFSVNLSVGGMVNLGFI